MQSERTALYSGHATRLLESGHAYRCFCSAPRLYALAVQRNKLGLSTDYDRTCATILQNESDRRAGSGEPHVIRLRAPDVYPDFYDLTYGKHSPSKSQQKRKPDNGFDDPILLKSDGLPTYHLANVVDDHLMNITHVIRGTEWLPTTSKHMALYEALGWVPPAYAHVSLVTNADGNKLSKRNVEGDIRALANEMDIMPVALTNFVAFLGWSYNEKNQVMTMEELIDAVRFT